MGKVILANFVFLFFGYFAGYLASARILQIGGTNKVYKGEVNRDVE